MIPIKKRLTLLLCGVLLCSALCGTACGRKKPPKEDEKTDESLRFGVGIHGSVTNDQDSGTLEAALAAVLVDGDGKVVACVLDAVSMTTAFSPQGEITPVSDPQLQSKYELGDAYTMPNYETGQTTTWAQQADALRGVLKGKTLSQIQQLVIHGGPRDGEGVDAVQDAGCTITISALVLAVEEAIRNAQTEVSGDATLRLCTANEQEPRAAAGDGHAANTLSAHLFAAALDDRGKVLTAHSDCIETTFAHKDGAVSPGDPDDRLSKRQKGDAYNLKGVSSVGKEWYEQADAFDGLCVGKTADDIKRLMADDGYGIEAVQAAGCTVSVSGMVKAASKI